MSEAAHDIQGFAGETEIIRSRPAPDCYLCGEPGKALYRNLTDRTFGAPGHWNHRRCLSPRCGLIWLDPMPLTSELVKAYIGFDTHRPPKRSQNQSVTSRIRQMAKHGYLARNYGYLPSAPASQQWLSLLVHLRPGGTAMAAGEVMYLKASPGRRLLDVGCGSGEFVERMAKLGWNAEGIDFDPEAIHNGASRGLRVSVGSLVEQHYCDSCFDAVCLNHSLEHMPEPLETLRQVRRILKPGGRMTLTVPNADSLGHRIFGSNWIHLDPPRHLYLFGPRSLRHMAIAAGLASARVDTIGRMGYDTYVASSIVRATGRFNTLGHHRSPRLRAAGKAFALLEALALSVNPLVGEELLLTTALN